MISGKKGSKAQTLPSLLYDIPSDGQKFPRSRSPSNSTQRQLDEADLFMDLIKDVANELDIDVLCHKVLHHEKTIEQTLSLEAAGSESRLEDTTSNKSRLITMEAVVRRARTRAGAVRSRFRRFTGQL
ncbi:cGMP-specific 3',5'-cyclic phosphodiesterase [Eumeta japonica]|uniref:cGMP-specific 3',5'-cyclic phosphodiesterase n=1 Tax=Eumeta variegata TaxID=151549 RepID=A0A4C1ZN73_EUMVA|nr:cGMP-specific 3',5'-cyclic phosphodiesterase [Eumeta japonica]